MPRGVEHYRARFTEAQVVAIREARQGGSSYAELGRQYSARSDTIRNLCLGYTYGDVGGPIGGSSTARRKIDEKLAREVKAAHSEGMSYKKVCEEFGIGMILAHRFCNEP
jgi:transposase-like protein